MKNCDKRVSKWPLAIFEYAQTEVKNHRWRFFCILKMKNKKTFIETQKMLMAILIRGVHGLSWVGFRGKKYPNQSNRVRSGRVGFLAFFTPNLNQPSLNTFGLDRVGYSGRQSSSFFFFLGG